jgi:hypothetical protein
VADRNDESRDVRSGVERSSSDAGPYSGTSALAEHRDSIEKHEFMLGTERGRLAVSLDMLTDALILIGQHGVYCVSSRNPTKPALDLQTVLDQINGAKQLIQSTMAELERKRDETTKPGALP